MVLQSPLKIQVLVSALNNDIDTLPSQMNIETDAVIVNQCDRYDYKEFPVPMPEEKKTESDAKVSYESKSGGVNASPGRIQCICMPERGVGLSRNTALLHADADICLFSDEDIVLAKGYAKQIRTAYMKYPDADMIIFNVKVSERRRTYWNNGVKRIRWYNYSRYPAYSISGKLEAFRRANVYFSLLFGGGAKYSNGEDSLFLRDCIKAGLKIYAHPLCIGEEIERESTWFHGYTEKFFTDRGVLYSYLYGKMAKALALRFLLRNKGEMYRDIPFKKAYRLMHKGIRSQRKHNKE